MSLPDWKKVIDTEFNNYKSGKQNKTGYLTNVVGYFTGGGGGNYPVKGQKVQPTDLTVAELLKYELYDFDIRKMAFEIQIQNNIVLNNNVPKNWAGVKANIDAAKTDGKYTRSPVFDSYSKEEQAIWNKCQIPMIGTGTTNSPTNHPLYNKLCDIYNNPASKALRDAGNWEKYYGDFCINGIGPADGFLGSDWNKQCYALTTTQLMGFQLPTDDVRRLQIAMNREKYVNALIKSPAGLDAGTQAAFKNNINACFDNNKYPLSPIVTEEEKKTFLTLPTGSNAFIAAPHKPIDGGRRRMHTRMRKGRRSGRATKNQKRKQKHTRRR